MSDDTGSFAGMVPVWDDGPGTPVYVWVCSRCGQPASPMAKCNSSLHVGPSEAANGEVVKSTEWPGKCPTCGGRGVVQECSGPPRLTDCCDCDGTGVRS